MVLEKSPDFQRILVFNESGFQELLLLYFKTDMFFAREFLVNMYHSSGRPNHNS